MTRHTVNTITSDALDHLYDRLDRIQDATQLHRQGLIRTSELYAVIEADGEPAPAATEATNNVACTCGGRFPLHHLHADNHQPKEN